MSVQTTAADQILQKYRAKDYMQYNRSHRYASLIGKNMNNIIQRDDSLSEDGESVRIPFTDDIAKRNIGTGTLTGNEAQFGQYSMDLKPIWVREAISIKKSEAKKAYTDHYAIQRRSLKSFCQNMMHDYVLGALSAVANDESAYVDAGTPDGATVAHPKQVWFSEATEGQKDTFVTNNADRVLFGSQVSNLVSGDMSASLANVDSTNDKMSTTVIEVAKRLARKDEWATGGVRPIRPVSADDEKGREMFLMIVGPVAMNNLYNDETMKSYNTDARLRGIEDHPLFQDGDLIYRGVTIREDPRIGLIESAGASSIDVEPFYFLGAQALGQAVGQKYQYTTDKQNDYDFLRKVGIEEQYSVEKFFFKNGQQHGMISGYVSGAE